MQFSFLFVEALQGTSARAPFTSGGGPWGFNAFASESRAGTRTGRCALNCKIERGSVAAWMPASTFDPCNVSL